MKFNITLKLAVLLAFTSIFFTACKDDTKEITPVIVETKDTTPTVQPIEVLEKNMSIVNKLTATWCGPCGDWGWTLFQGIIDASEKDAVIMGTYGSSTSNYYNPVADAFKKSQAPTAGWPAFCANGTNQTSYASNGGIYTDATKNNVIAEIAKFKAAPVLASAGYKTEIKDGKVTLQLKTKFFGDGIEAADYYVGAYVIEDGVVGYQAGNGAGNNAIHHHVLRASFTTDVWGTKIENGKTAGSTFEKTLELPLDPKWNQDNLEFAVIIWRKVGIKYTFVNATQHKS